MKNFNDIYDEIYMKYGKEIEMKGKSVKSKTIKILLMLLLLWLGIIIIAREPIIIGTSGLIILLIINYYINSSKGSKEYEKFYKDNVIKMIVKGCNEQLEYIPEKGIDKQIYHEGEFEEGVIYRTKDLIEGILDYQYKFNMAGVLTETKQTDMDSHILFHGIFAKIDLIKTVNTNIKIRKNKLHKINNMTTNSRKDEKLSFENMYKKLNAEINFKKIEYEEMLQMSSNDFNNNFFVYSDDKIITAQILTTDIEKMLLSFTKEYNIKPEITLKGNVLYVRFETGNKFETNLKLEYATLKEYYDIINFTIDITRKFLENM